MKRFGIALFGLLLLPLSIQAQVASIAVVTTLSAELQETSGLIWLEEHLITHNDSGSEPLLHEIDTLTGEISRSVYVEGASATDWEDICQDDTHIYIGNFGNNAGTRTDLAIYKIAISDYLTTPTDTVSCEVISFSYADQTDFEPATFTTNYDAEALISIGDSLYIFTKNWGDGLSNIYPVSKIPGTYSLEIHETIDPDGLVTGADYDAATNELFLVGYTFGAPFLILIQDVEGSAFLAGTFTRTVPSLSGSIQVEGVAVIGNHSAWISSEDHSSGSATLHKVTYAAFAGLTFRETPEQHLQIINTTQIKSSEFVERIVISDISGREKHAINEVSGAIHYIPTFPRGTYLITAYSGNGELLETVTYVAF